MKIKTFSIGGIHPEENKLTHEVATQVAPLPKKVISLFRSISVLLLPQWCKKAIR